MTTSAKENRIRARSEEIRATRSGLDRRWLALIESEITSRDVVSDDDFVRILECYLELAPHVVSLARAAAIDIGALSAWTDAGKRSGLDLIPNEERRRLLRCMHDEVARQCCGRQKGARMMNLNTVGKLKGKGQSLTTIAALVRSDIERCTSGDMSADTFYRFIGCFAEIDPHFARRTAMTLRFDEATMNAWVEKRERGSTLPMKMRRQSVLLLILDGIDMRLARAETRTLQAA